MPKDNDNGGHAGGEQACQGANARPLHWLPHHHRGAGIRGQREHNEHDHDDQGQAGHQGRPRLQEGHQAVVICDHGCLVTGGTFCNGRCVTGRFVGVPTRLTTITSQYNFYNIKHIQ